jgi:hypothetical protein
LYAYLNYQLSRNERSTGRLELYLQLDAEVISRHMQQAVLKVFFGKIRLMQK